MRNSVLIILLVIVCKGVLYGQEADTLIYAEGKIFASVTKEPIEAKITYRSEPFGSTVGVLSGNSFLFPLFDNEKYSLTIEAPGFAAAKYILDPAHANSERKVIQNIELTLPVAVANNTESAHTAGKTMNLENLIFNVGTAKMTPQSYPELDQLVKMLSDFPNMVIQLEGHTDTRGVPKLNMELSQERVDAVKTYLVSKGTNKNRIKTKAFGGTQPVSRENTEEAHKLNRRVVVRILEN